MISKKISDHTFDHKIIHVSELPFQLLKRLKSQLGYWLFGKPTFENMVDVASSRRDVAEDSFRGNRTPYQMSANRGLYYATFFSLYFWFLLIYFVVLIVR